VCFVLINLVMAIIPDSSARLKRLMMYERELLRKMAFDETFGESKQHNDELQRRSVIQRDNANVVAVDLPEDSHRF